MKFSARTTLVSTFVLTALASLSACTSTQDVLEPTALLGSETSAATAPLSPVTTSTNETVSPVLTSARVQFAPVIGAPANASAPLSARLSVRAASRGISLVANGQSSATLTMKGYFSAITDSGQTSVIYVWDVFDPAGTRIHRIQGQAKAPATTGDGWDGVQSATMEAIADDSIDQLANWLVTQQG